LHVDVDDAADALDPGSHGTRIGVRVVSGRQFVGLSSCHCRVVTWVIKILVSN
jgi:hypothetical protein